ncbi:hypothetical protein E2P64_06630 [Candidatus Bathyarchaeota archaeon]|nr:hypothetical protein E2P64_06630 [Candidatus Bathyarchaeota archaeon]
MKKVLTEALSFRQLWNASDYARKRRAAHVKPRQMWGSAEEGPDLFQFSYKSDPGWSTTGKRWHGYVRLMKEENVDNRALELQDMDCMVDCDCPDYRYRFAYGNAKQDASVIGRHSWNQNNGQYPEVMGERIGLCKHLMSLVEYLGAKIEPVAPEPEEPSPPMRPRAKAQRGVVPPKKVMPAIPSPSKVGMAPEPPKEKPSYYSDTRAGDLLEKKGTLFERLSAFIKRNPEFTIPYYEE